MKPPTWFILTVQLVLQSTIGLLAPIDVCASSGVVVSVRGQKIVVPTMAGGKEAIERNIADCIRSALLDSAIRDFGITVQDDVLAVCVDAYFQAGSVTEKTADAVRVRSEKIVAALRAVIGGKDSQIVYKENLAMVIEPAEWDIWVRNYSSLDRVEQLERLIPKSIVDMKLNSSHALRRDLEMWLLFRKVAGLAWEKQDDSGRSENTQHSEAEPPSTPNGKVVIQTYPERAVPVLETWWLQHMRRSNISVPDEYIGALTLVKSLPVVGLPKGVVTALDSMVPIDGVRP